MYLFIIYLFDSLFDCLFIYSVIIYTNESIGRLLLN